jgi:hypothetical protein
VRRLYRRARRIRSAPPRLAEEIAETLGVATAVNAGAALVYSARVPDAYEQVTPRSPA